MLSIGALSSAAQGASYYERDGYYAKDDPEHRDASAWAGKGAEELGLKGTVDADTFRQVLEGRVPDGSDTRLGRRGKDGSIEHRPGRDLTFSAPKSVSIAALVGGDRRIVEAHDRAVAATLAWVEKNVAETRMKDPDTGMMGRVSGQKIVAATFRHDTSRNLDPQLHTHAVLANMVQGEDGKWRSMANESLYANQKLIGMLYRSELAAGLGRLGYGIEKTHADGRFEIAGVSREEIEAFSSRRAEIEAAMDARGLGASADNPRIAERAALMTRAREARHRPRRARGRVAAPGRRSRAGCERAGHRRRGTIRPGGTGSGARVGLRGGQDAGSGGAGAAGHRRRARTYGYPRYPRRPKIARPSGRMAAPRSVKPLPTQRRPRARLRPLPGRWRISPSARRCSRAPTCSRLRSPMRRARCRSETPSGKSRRWRRPERCMP